MHSVFFRLEGCCENAWFYYGGAVFDQEALWELLGSILGPLGGSISGPFRVHFRVPRRLEGPRGADPMRGQPPQGILPGRFWILRGPFWGPFGDPFRDLVGSVSGPTFASFLALSRAPPGTHLGSH